jgi:hypothetical protein
MMALALGLGVVALSISIVTSARYRERLSAIFEPLADEAIRPTGEITGSIVFAQTFRATRSDLAEIEVFLSNYGQPNQTPLVLRLTDVSSGDLQRLSMAPPGTVANDQYHSFRFAPIPNSEGRTFVVTLTAPEAQPGHAVTAWMGEDDPYPQGIAYLNGVPQARSDIVAKLEYHSPIKGVLDELVNRTSQYKPRFFKGVNLMVLALLALVVMLVAGVAVATSLLKLEDENASRPRTVVSEF